MYKLAAILLLCALSGKIAGQNSMVGDGFGGRLWYKPYNYTVGSYSAYTVCGDSDQLLGWGANLLKQLGNGKDKGTDIPVKALYMTSVKFYTTGYVMAVIKKDGSLWVWGSSMSNVPTQVDQSVKFADAGISVVTYVKNDGSVWSVGMNYLGTFGNGKVNTGNTMTPVKMSNVSFPAVRVANGYLTNTILLANGNLMSVGTNTAGGLGLGNSVSFQYTPVNIPGISNIVDIKAAASTNIALDKNGFVYAWGSNSFGAIGDGTTVNCNSPKRVRDLKNIVAISGCNDGEFFLALDSQNNCYAWGDNSHSQLGYPGVINLTRPQVVATDVVEIMAGETFAYIIKKDNSLWCVGRSLSFGSSIWLNLSNTLRTTYTKLDPSKVGGELCQPKEMRSSFTFIILCEGQTYKVGDHLYSKSGQYIDTLLTSYNGDSIVVSNLKFLPKTDSSVSYSLCLGKEILLGDSIYSGAGTYVDTLQNYLGCDSILQYRIRQLNPTDTAIQLELCPGQYFVVNGTSYGREGSFSDTLLNHAGCDSVIRISIRMNALKAGFDIDSSEMPEFHFKNTSTHAVQYRWDFGTGNKQAISRNAAFNYYPDTGNYIVCLTVVSPEGCMDSLCRMIRYVPNTFFLANVFTPGNDGWNDRYRIAYWGQFTYDLLIHNRWGAIVYEARNVSVRDESLYWNGQVMNKGAQCPSGVYFYTFRFYLKGADKEPTVVSGSVNLIRQPE